MSKLYFRQLRVGHMDNFVYLIGDREKQECVVVDPAWDIAHIINTATKDNMKIVGALATHYHPDHVGGHIFGLDIEGLAELMAQNPCKVHAHKLEKSGIIQVTQLSTNDIIGHDSGDVVNIGDISIELLHTPGHTPGSLCFRLKQALVSGDTLFLRGCGRVDLPGGDVSEMYRTIHERLSTVSKNTIVYPGHSYGGDHEELGVLYKTNPVFEYHDIKAFMRLFG